MTTAIAWAERHQIALYLAAIAVGAGVGLAIPDAAASLEHAITPALGLLLYVTFLGVPFAALARAFRDGRFLATVLVVNFVVLPLVVFGLSRFVAGEPALLVGVLLVLLTPCIDYVIVFTGLAGGSRERLLAATPLLMLAQMALLPLFLWLMAGAEVLAAFDVRPFVEAFLLLIVLPLALAVATQLLGRRARAWTSGALATMVPLMMIVLAVVVGSQIAGVGGAIGSLLVAVPIFVAFAVVAVVVGVFGSRGLDVPSRRAVVFSGVTRNSLVVLPLALALPASFALAPLVVVTQTLVELIVMVALVWALPRVLRSR